MTFFGRDRVRMVDAVGNIGARLCQYTHYDRDDLPGSRRRWRDGRCDCKYGANGVGEQTGCPELRNLLAMLEQYSDEEWQTLVNAGGGIMPMQLATALEKPIYLGADGKQFPVMLTEGRGFLPVGTVVPAFQAEALRVEAIPCDGREYDMDKYVNLASALSVAGWLPEGHVPDLRGRVVA